YHRSQAAASQNSGEFWWASAAPRHQCGYGYLKLLASRLVSMVTGSVMLRPVSAFHLRKRAVEMRASSKELKDHNTAALIMRLADLYDRLADRGKTRGTEHSGVQCSGDS